MAIACCPGSAIVAEIVSRMLKSVTEFQKFLKYVVNWQIDLAKKEEVGAKICEKFAEVLEQCLRLLF
ncbi:unnamed protein product [Notodromas monacha]|uniref:Uncharacterized protein n=1 Tax=Notodromas monacha TaxID=399045 RepID=A0A7R9BXL5_9CRUS|nr:unnamed protein product [Notodromas monacha]CAG0922529.1 unnamed protein product [Notodromas monacha]